MDNFQIQPNTDAELGPQIKKSVQSGASFGNGMEVDRTDEVNWIMCLLAVIFKIIYILEYCLLRFLADSYLGLFVTTTIIISIDFWVTKNLTGRKLVGLRWWSQISESGQQEWVFESRNPKRKVHTLNSSFFWFPQITTLAFWVIIFIVNFISLDFFLISLALFCFALSSINFICYFKCKGQHQKKARELTVKAGIQAGSQML